MKLHTQSFKENIKEMGRELDSKITYIIDGEEIELGSEILNSITPHYEANILKSVMKQLDVDSNVDIPLNTVLNYKFGVRPYGQGEFEYVDFGNYIVYSSEKQEDTNSYKLICYDKMLYSMKNYEAFVQKYPISVKDYIEKLCDKLGLVFKNKDGIFANADKIIPNELYLSSDGKNIGYTFRDVFDELAQVTASMIVINEDTDEVEIRYINETNDTIDEEYLKDVNVNFGEKYGPINSIVLSRTAESDNVYLRDEKSIKANGLCEIKISENQIMNFNNRDEFLPEILEKLNGLEYYMNDYESYGIMYYNICDRYNVKIGNNNYSCIMFNDSAEVTQGLGESIYCDRPDDSETDYTKADKTDRRMNQTYLIVDKQNQIIEGVITNVDNQNEKIAKISAKVDEIDLKVSQQEDLTIDGETNHAVINVDNINQSEPIQVKIHPNGYDISLYYPSSILYPSNNLFPRNSRTLRFTNLSTEEAFDYEIPYDLLYYDVNNYDEFILDYYEKKCYINKKICFTSEFGNNELMSEPQILELEYPSIQLSKGNYRIELLGYNSAYIYTKLMRQNDLTDIFATKIELNSAIIETSNSINLSINGKLDTMENNFVAKLELKVDIENLVSELNASADVITLNSNRLVVNSDKFSLSETGDCVANSFTSNNAKITGGIFELESPNKTSKFILKDTTENIVSQFAPGFWDMRKYDDCYFNISWDGGTGWLAQIRTNEYNVASITASSMFGTGFSVSDTFNDLYTTIRASGISTPVLTQTSQAEKKKNIEIFSNALELILNSDVYKYNLKNEEETSKKHIGLVIGENYKCCNEVINEDRTGIEQYSMISICWQAIKELYDILNIKKENNDE